MTANILSSKSFSRETTGNQSSHYHHLRHARARTQTGLLFSFSIKQREESIQTVAKSTCLPRYTQEEEEEGRFLACVGD
jgi:cystathionine beta-lyase/cystathionine gamma-synthase